MIYGRLGRAFVVAGGVPAKTVVRHLSFDTDEWPLPDSQMVVFRLSSDRARDWPVRVLSGGQSATTVLTDPFRAKVLRRELTGDRAGSKQSVR